MTPPNPNASDADTGCGQRLRNAREAAGLSVADVSSQLKSPTYIIEALESGDFARIGAPVFVRGHLHSYSRLLGLPSAPVQEASGVAPIEPTRLVPRTQTPRMQRIADQVGGRLVTIVVTAMMLVLPVWMATHSRGEILPEAAPLDLPADQAATQQKSKPAVAREPSTVVASMASLPRQGNTTPGLALSFGSDSWVEITAPDGSIVEKTLVKAGDKRAYAVGVVGRVVLGNASGVEVRSAGHAQDLEPYMRANVARFAVSSDGSLAPVSN